MASIPLIKQAKNGWSDNLDVEYSEIDSDQSSGFGSGVDSDPESIPLRPRSSSQPDQHTSRSSCRGRAKTQQSKSKSRSKKSSPSPPSPLFSLRSTTARNRLIRAIGVTVGAIVISIIVYLVIVMVQATRRENAMLDWAWNRHSTGKGGYGAQAVRPAGWDSEKIEQLDESLLPGVADPSSRLVVVGDVHGHKDELSQLLEKIGVTDHDHVIFVGDLVTKGPDSAGVVDLVRSMGATSVRGNHEDRLLVALETKGKNKHKYKSSMARSNGQNKTVYVDDNSGMTISSGSVAAAKKTDLKLAQTMSEDQLDWMASCPVVLDVGLIPGFGHLIVVHGGLVPGVAPDRQDPFDIMNMRTLDIKTNVPSSARKGGVSWAKVWNHFQSKMDEPDRRIIAYGHDAHRGLKIKKYTYGLDSGCGNSHKLTGLVINPDGSHTLEQVRCS